MSRLAGPIGALVGGGIGFAVGGGWAGARLGASVGWIVGSWVGSALTDEKKDNFKPENMPKFNTAIRGATIPILFGTNRVAAQIAWQGNFQATRNADAGGKAGGSGGPGGGGKGGASGGPSYSYKISLVYHLGQVPSPVSLIRVWNNGHAISAASLREISTSHAATFLGPQPATEEQASNLESDGSIFFDGSAPAISNWSVIQAAAGRAVTWPGTVWLGFDSLVLGGSPSIPQLSFEIGTSNFRWDYSSTPLGKSVDLGTGSHFVSRKPDVFNNVWTMESSDPGVGGLMKCYSAATGALLSTYYMETVARESWITGNANGFSYVFQDSHRAVITNDGTTIAYLTTFLINDSGAGDVNGKKIAYIIIGKPNNVGTISWIGSCYTEVPLLYSGNNIFAITGSGGERDNFLFDNNSSTNTDTTFHYAPSISVIGGQNNLMFATNAYRFTTASYRKNWLSTFTTSQQGPGTLAAALPVYNVGGTLTANRIVYYFGKGYAAGNGKNGQASFDNLWVDAWRPSHTNGGMVYLLITAAPAFNYSSIEFSYVNMADPVADDSNFFDESHVAFSSFSDDWLDITNASANSNHYYQSDPFVYAMDTGTFLVIWPSISSTDSSYGSDYRPKSNVRLFIYDGKTNKFYAIKNLQTVSFGRMITEYGGTDSGVVAAGHLALKIVNNRLYIYLRINNSNDSPKNVYIWIDAGAFNPSDADVYPPYIIREILTNTRWGLYPDGGIIDETSYDKAIKYCTDNDIKISTVINQQESATQIFSMLLAVYDGWLSIDAASNRIKFGVMDLSPSPVRTIDNKRLVRQSSSPPVTSTKGARQDTYNLIKVNYFDRNLNYEQNQIQEGDEVDQDLNGIRVREFPLRFVMQELTARRLAVRTLWSNLYGKDTHSFQLGWRDADLEPGDLITLVDSFSGLNQVVQITRMAEKERGIFDVSAQQQLQYVPGLAPSQVSSAQWDYINTGGISSYTSAASPYEFNVIQGVYGPRESTAFELPKEFEISGTSHVFVSWAALGRPAGATLYVSADGLTYGPVKSITPYQVAGTLLTNLPNNSNFSEGMELFLAPSSNYTTSSNYWDYMDYLTDVSQEAMHAGAGLIWVGSEMISFASLTLVAQNKYRAARAYRGWGGTPVGAHGSGDTFYRQGAGMFVLPYIANQIGNTLYYKVAPFGFNGVEYPVSSIAAKQYSIQGLFYRPRLPAQIQYEGRRGETRFNVGAAVEATIIWEECAQQSGFGAGGNGKNGGGYGAFAGDVASLGYHVSVVGSGSIVVRSSYVSTGYFSYTSAQNAADNGAWRGNIAIKVTPANPYGLANGFSVLSLELFV